MSDVRPGLRCPSCGADHPEVAEAIGELQDATNRMIRSRRACYLALYLSLASVLLTGALHVGNAIARLAG